MSVKIPDAAMEENGVYCYAFFICNYVAFLLATWTKIPIKLYMLWPIAIFSIVAFLYDPFMQARFYGGVALIYAGILIV